MPEESDTSENGLKEAAAVYRAAFGEAEPADIDLSLLKENLARTPWERMLANDDALNFAESLRTAMERRRAQSK